MKTFFALRNTLLLVSLVLATGFASEEATAEPIGWTNDATASVNISQAGYSNWVSGGEDTYTWQALLQGNSQYDQLLYAWKNQGKLAFGRTQVGDLNSRKSVDEILAETMLEYKLTRLLKPYMSVRFQSQFTTGYFYSDTARRAAISTFMAPGYLTESAGLGLQPHSTFTTRLGLALKQTFSEKYGWADDPTTQNEVETFRFEPGLESISQFTYSLSDILKLQSTLSSFVNFEGVEKIDGKWENSLQAQVSKYIQFSAGFDMLYDWDLSTDTQYRHALTAGLVYRLL